MSFFFVILFLSLFIPTNHPGLTETYFALVIGTFLVNLRNKQRWMPSIDRTAIVLWALIATSLLLSTIFSRSAGMSLLTLIRYMEGGIIFLLANSSTLSPIKFSRYLGLFTLGASTVFLICFGYTAITHNGYLYNSITAVNGHHPISYTILMALPLIGLISGIPSFLWTVFIAMASLLLSGARGAWLVSILFLILSGTRLGTVKYRASAFIAILFLTIAIGAATWAAHLPHPQKDTIIERVPILQFYIKDSNAVMRKAFAQQALTAFRHSPIVGHGPGTFSLLSRQYQVQPGYYSQYAHSFPLETLAETGIIGGLSIGALFLYLLYRSVRAVTAHSSYAPLGWSVIITLIYSVFEVNLNSLPHWLLFWAIAGVVCKPALKTGQSIHRAVATIMRMLLLTFALTSLAAWWYMGFKNIHTALRFAPYNKTLLLAALEQPATKSTPITNAATLWHKKDPDILIRLAEQQPGLYPLVIQLDPHNTLYLNKYLTRLVGTSDVTALSRLLCSLPEILTDSCPLMENRSFADFVKEKTHFFSALNHLSGNDGQAKFLYSLGLIYQQDTADPQTALYLWQKTLRIAPQWGFYYLEVAGGQYYWLGDTVAAQETLSSCLMHPLARKGCISIRQAADLNPPGTYADDISIIPAIQ